MLPALQMHVICAKLVIVLIASQVSLVLILEPNVLSVIVDINLIPQLKDVFALWIIVIFATQWHLSVKPVLLVTP